MKKCWIVAAVLFLTGCAAEDKAAVNEPQTQHPVVTPQVSAIPEENVPSTTEETDDEEAMEGIEHEEMEIPETEEVESSIGETTLQGKFTEQDTANPTTMTFYEDGTVEISLNNCSDFTTVHGVYTKDATSLTLDFPQPELDFLAQDAPYHFDFAEGELQLNDGEKIFSCSAVDVYRLN